ncbi:MAG TPA: hypothetical protein VFC85_00300 [Verrucomicrobiae bacterium]|nr:hypothetical protein [Verrucomicrobiae bacterium]
MKQCEAIYPPVTRFERRTSHCPLYVALFILDEARNYFWTELPPDLADELAQKAEIVFAGNARWRKKIQGRRGRAYLEMFMRHWLASALFQRKSPLFRQLPPEFKIGKPLPIISLPRQLAMEKEERMRPAKIPQQPFNAHRWADLHCVV